MHTNRLLRFEFASIMLPDSNVNLEASQGVVNFSDDHDPGFLRGDRIEIRADIYFDYTPPIITTTSTHFLTLGLRRITNRLLGRLGYWISPVKSKFAVVLRCGRWLGYRYIWECPGTG